MFIYGFDMADQPDPRQPQTADPQSEEILRQEGIHCPEASSKITPHLRSVIARLHKNMGHPRASELKKLLTMNGVSNPNIYNAFDHMKCHTHTHTCDRNKLPPNPAPAGDPTEGYLQFGDRVQCDTVYIRDVSGKNHPVLGIICETTHLHIVARLENRTPEEASKKFHSSWVSPYGYPLVLKTDPDGTFQGAFEADLQLGGTFVDYIPPEAHSQLGLVEQHHGEACR